VEDHDPTTSGTPTTVLSVGLHPSAIDYGRYPGLDEATMTARIDAGDAALRERLVNVINEVAPGISFCFNTSPESTIEALRRW
jgi:hypothetical protein